MCAQVVEIGDFRLKRERHRLLDGCQHKHLTLDDEGEFVTCDDCKKQIGTMPPCGCWWSGGRCFRTALIRSGRQ